MAQKHRHVALVAQKHMQNQVQPQTKAQRFGFLTMHLGEEPGSVVFALAHAEASLGIDQYSSGQLRRFTEKNLRC